MQTIIDEDAAKIRLLRIIAILLGAFSFATVLAVHHYADGDMWAKLALGAHVWIKGSILPQDVFAFTPILPKYIDHEWGAGYLFYAFLKGFGPSSLTVLKIGLALGALSAAMAAGRRIGSDWNALLVLAIPCAACLFVGYVPVIRSHTFTYFFFGITLWCLEEMRAGRKQFGFVVPPIMLVWANVHGGFVSGLCTVGVYSGFAALEGLKSHGSQGNSAIKEAWIRCRFLLLILILCLAVTFINPYGLEFWRYLIPALLHKRPWITEWLPLPIFAHDAFTSFRVMFVVAIVLLALGWRRAETKSWPGLLMVVITAVIAWRSRRHAPFFAVATLAFLGPFVAATFSMIAEKLSPRLQNALRPTLLVVIVHAVLAGYMASSALPSASFQVLAPVRMYPVREVDVLMHAKAKGNLVVPFSWGSYAAWRLYPDVKISMDGRYETTFPESTFLMNEDFYNKRGDWTKVLRDHKVDYIILDMTIYQLRPNDLLPHGYDLVWLDRDHSALLALTNEVPALRRIAIELPPTTIDPVDASIPMKWWSK
jgi:hypothetical protein